MLLFGTANAFQVSVTCIHSPFRYFNVHARFEANTRPLFSFV
jgi:hypothetical protein